MADRAPTQNMIEVRTCDRPIDHKHQMIISRLCRTFERATEKIARDRSSYYHKSHSRFAVNVAICRWDRRTLRTVKLLHPSCINFILLLLLPVLFYMLLFMYSLVNIYFNFYVSDVRLLGLSHAIWEMCLLINAFIEVVKFNNNSIVQTVTGVCAWHNARQGLKTLFVSTRTSCSELRTSCSRRKDKRILWSSRTMTWMLPRLRASSLHVAGVWPVVAYILRHQPIASRPYGHKTGTQRVEYKVLKNTSECTK